MSARNGWRNVVSVDYAGGQTAPTLGGMRHARPPRVGIPAALAYYHYFPWWQAYFTRLGAEVVTSGATTKGILNAGVATAPDEVCLPVKVYYGHALALAGQVDFLFVPRIVRVEPRAYTCPKFLGLPDLLRGVPGLPPIVAPTWDEQHKGMGAEGCLRRAAREMGLQGDHREAFGWGWEVQETFQRRMREGMAWEQAAQAANSGSRMAAPHPNPPPGGERDGQSQNPDIRSPGAGRVGQPVVIAVVGHNYNLYDRFVSHNLLGRLRKVGAEPRTVEMVPPECREREAARLPKPLFWTYEKEILGAAFHLARQGVEGLVNVASFECGPDSMIDEFMAQEVRGRLEVPMLTLTLDEHTAEAGLVTRLEAFVDMIRRQRRVA